MWNRRGMVIEELVKRHTGTSSKEAPKSHQYAGVVPQKSLADDDTLPESVEQQRFVFIAPPKPSYIM
jgi:hypothetical protein